jgi:hypothetical protein
LVQYKVQFCSHAAQVGSHHSIELSKQCSVSKADKCTECLSFHQHLSKISQTKMFYHGIA